MPTQDTSSPKTPIAVDRVQAYVSARAYLAALADAARTFEAASDYENILIELDRLHGPHMPIIDVVPVEAHQPALTTGARLAIERMSAYIDPLDLALVLTMLTDAVSRDL